MMRHEYTMDMRLGPAGPTNVMHFASLTECVMTAHAVDPYGVNAGTIEAFKRGSEEIAARSDRLLGKVEAKLEMPETIRPITADVSGGVVNIGAHLAGHPMAMRTRRPALNLAETSPAVVMINTFSSSGAAGGLATRAPAILALVRAMQKVRPVKLVLYELTDVKNGCNRSRTAGNSGGVLLTCEVDTAPMDLNRAAWAVGSDAFTLGVALALQRGNENHYHCYDASEATEYLDAWAKSQGFDEVINIDSGTTHNGDAFRDEESALAWLNKHLARYRNQADAA